MKKTILYFFALAWLNVGAQSLTLEPHENPVLGSSSDFELVTEISVTNNTSEPLDLIASRQVISTSQGTSNYFCWDLCYPSNVNFSTGTLTLQPNETNETSFSIHYQPNGRVSQTEIKYCVYEQSNIGDSVCVNVRFSTEVSNITEQVEASFSEFQPNPVITKTNLDYQLNVGQSATIIISDMLGTLVAERHVYDQKGNLSFDFSTLKTGLYFANILVDGQLQSVKRIVKTD